MKFLVVLCLLALAAADEDKIQDKKTQPLDATQNTSSLTQPSLLSGQVFPTSFSNVFGTTDPVSPLTYTGFNGSPIQTVNPDFFTSQTTGAIPTFPVTRAVLPGTSAIVNGIQSAFPVTGNAFPATGNAFTATGNAFPAVAAIPAAVSAIPAQFPAQFQQVGAGILSAVPTGGLDANSAAAGTPDAAYRLYNPNVLTGIASQALQPAQQIGLAAIPAFTSGILPSLSQGILQGQSIQSGIQQVLKNPTTNPTGISNVPGLTTGNIASGPLANVFRRA